MTGARRLFALVFVWGMTLYGGVGLAADLKLPFDVEIQRNLFGTPIARASCRSVPRPVVDMTGSGAKVDEAVKTVLYRFQRHLNEMSDDYVRSRPANDFTARCVLDWLNAWAAAGSMLGEVNDEGAYVRKWGVAPVAMSYAKIRNARYLDETKVHTVENWLRRLGQVIRDDYSSSLGASSRANHHLYWAAWGVMSAAAAVGDDELFDWSVGRVRFALGQVRSDGRLPWALERGKKALYYHLYSVAPLVLAATFASANGVDLFEDNAGALRRLVKTTLTGIENPRAFQGGKSQTGVSPPDVEDMAWLIPYAARFPGDVDQRWFRTFRKFESRQLGGDMKLLFANSKTDMVLR